MVCHKISVNTRIDKDVGIVCFNGPARNKKYISVSADCQRIASANGSYCNVSVWSCVFEVIFCLEKHTGDVNKCYCVRNAGSKKIPISRCLNHFSVFDDIKIFKIQTTIIIIIITLIIEKLLYQQKIILIIPMKL